MKSAITAVILFTFLVTSNSGAPNAELRALSADLGTDLKLVPEERQMDVCSDVIGYAVEGTIEIFSCLWNVVTMQKNLSDFVSAIVAFVEEILNCFTPAKMAGMIPIIGDAVSSYIYELADAIGNVPFLNMLKPLLVGFDSSDSNSTKISSEEGTPTYPSNTGSSQNSDSGLGIPSAY